MHVQLDVHSYSTGKRLAEWVPYVLSARCDGEQNMEATLVDGLLYFRVTRHVNASSELLIWYSDQLAQLLGVPTLDSVCRSGTARRAQGFPSDIGRISKITKAVMQNTLRQNNDGFRPGPEEHSPTPQFCSSLPPVSWSLMVFAKLTQISDFFAFIKVIVD